MKVLAYNSSARGSGQFVRSLKIARIITGAFPSARCVILVGNSYVEARVPERTDVVRLPEIRKSTDGHYLLPSADRMASPLPINDLSGAFAVRKRMIRSIIDHYAPDVFLVDSRPAGLDGELFAALETCSARPACRTVLMLRDIVDDPSSVVARWTDDGTYRLIAHAYDKVVVFGVPWIFDVIENYQLSFSRSKVFYLGYLGHGWPAVAPHAAPAPDGTPPRILVTVGGGFDGGKILETVCHSLRAAADDGLRFAATVVLGNNSPLTLSDFVGRYDGRSRGTRIVRHVPSLDGLMAETDLVVSMCGYNTLLESIEMKKKIIAVPRTHSGFEQIMRARLLRSIYDRLWIIPENELTAERFGQLLPRALTAPPPSAHLDMDGAANLVAFLGQEVWR